VRALFLKLEGATTALSTFVACGMLAISAGLGLWQIITRFIIERPAEWTEVLIRFSLIWMVFMGIPLAFRIGAMVSVDVLHRLSGPRMRRVLDTLATLAALALVSIVIVVGWDYAQRQGAERHRPGRRLDVLGLHRDAGRRAVLRHGHPCELAGSPASRAGERAMREAA
jgi:TRAP-type C4-dicarboxylate transport system permease small subunit